VAGARRRQPASVRRRAATRPDTWVQQEPAGTIALELVDVIESDLSPKMELFSLHFRGPFRPRLDQQTHRLEHEILGDFEIFLTPISADQQNGTIYEAVFHRFRKS